MKFQDTKADCGPTALYNALHALGLRRTPQELAVLCRTTAQDGTSSAKLLAAVRKLELSAWRIRETRDQAALGLMLYALENGRPLVCVVDRGEHWVAVVGRLGNRVLVADSADNALILSYGLEEWLARWNCGGRAPYEAVVL
jgi:ABC-type bacteriocin/lantibiotic exporter with double-glycine peptidase domain